MREAIHTVMDNGEDYLDMLKKLTTTGTFKMTDAERINLIFEIEKRTRGTHHSLNGLEEQLDRQIYYAKSLKFMEDKDKRNYN